MIILDTNVISELMKATPSPAVLAWTGRYAPEDQFTSAISMAEILLGIELLPHGKRRDGLLREAEAIFSEDFASRVLFFDEQAAKMFAVVASSRRKKGKPMSEFDAQIAAIARAHNATLATRNTKDFEGCGVRLINPWEG